jgi:hypothetical protein
MKTPIQELIEIIKKRQEDDEAIPFMYNEQIIELAESMLEKEKEMMVDFSFKCRNLMAADEFAITHWYDKTFN